MADIPTAPRYDRYGEIRCIGHVVDKGTRKTWVVIRRKGGSKAFAVAQSEWLAFAEARADSVMPIVDPTLWISRERQQVTALLTPVYEAVVALVRAYDAAVEKMPKLREAAGG